MKKVTTRRHRALRNIAIAVIVIVLHSCISYYSLTQMMALKYAKERVGIYDETEVVTMQRVPELHRFHHLYMIENENTVALSSVILRFVGWEGGFAWPVDCTQDRPLHFGAVRMNHSGENKGNAIIFFYGRIDDKSIERIELLEVTTEYSSAEDEIVFKDIISSIESPRSEWMEKNGHYYFLEKIKATDNWSAQHHIRAYDGDGAVVYESQSDNQSGVSWG